METNTDMAVSGTVFPLGISDFENLISNGMVYIDKTSCLEELLTPGTGFSDSEAPEIRKDACHEHAVVGAF